MKSWNGLRSELKETLFFRAFKTWQALFLFGTLRSLPCDGSDQNRRSLRVWSQEPARKVPLSGPSWGDLSPAWPKRPTRWTHGQHPLSPNPHCGVTTWHLEKGSQVESLSEAATIPPLCLLESYSKAWLRCHFLCEAFLGVPLSCQSESVTRFLMLLLLWALVGRFLCPTRLRTGTVSEPPWAHTVSLP